MLTQNHVEHIKDQIERGLMTTDQGNVKLVLAERVKVVTKLPRDVRKTLNNAVKKGELLHMKKDGKKPEVYCHPEFQYLANERRYEEESKVLKALAAVCRYPK